MTQGPNQLVLSVVIPAHNEQENLVATVTELTRALDAEGIPHQIIIVNDNSSDETQQVAEELAGLYSHVDLVLRTTLPGFGRAIRAGLSAVSGDVVVIVMADRSEDPRDVVRCYRKIEEGYDCVFGSRFRKGSVLQGYPPFKLLINRIVNTGIQMLFLTKFNDLTNAFKVYRREVIAESGPFSASHFNITIELSLSALIRKYRIAEIPVNWYGRTWGSTNLRLTQMGRRYLSVLLKLFFEKLLIADDILAERQMERSLALERIDDLEKRDRRLGSIVARKQ